jgi:lipopolysaccharide/colanic/teichoic acid biosynthesis glycosyltransferase
MATVAEPAIMEKTSYLFLKRLIDVIGAAVLLVIFAPLLVFVAAAIRLDSHGPAIYRQKRVGRFGKHFVMLKFRTMKVGTPTLSTAEMQQWLKAGGAANPYTRIGPILRKTNLDELPQLWNVLRGEMSFIGPRPALPSQEDVVNLRENLGVHSVRPGITGLAQVMGRDDLDVETKVNYDAQYCRELSFILDLSILFRTFGAVLSGRGNK